MYMNDALKKDECRNEVLQELRKLGVKCRTKKPKQQNVKSGFKAFKVPLGALSTETISLQTGQQLAVPKLVHRLCSLVLSKVSTEGIFRKEGSRNRQTEMKVVLNSGGYLEETDNVIDVAVMLKTFLRELPEPLVPFGYHELFLRSSLLEKPHNVEAILLACLLLPPEYLNTLTYLLQFFYEVARNSKKNKMNAYNLAVVVAPNIFPIEEKLNQRNVQSRTAKITEIVEILIESAPSVGVLPESIIDRVGANNNAAELKKKKRRSGSLTRMFNGLKKMVGGKSGEDGNVVTPDLLLTPVGNIAVKKQRAINGMSNRKKKELVSKLPDGVLLTAPFTPISTPAITDNGEREKQNELGKEKKSQWFSRSRSVKNLKSEEPLPQAKPFKTTLERRWSSITQPMNGKRAKKRNSFSSFPTGKDKNGKSDTVSEPDYIRVSKVEYEAIKNRVSAMERRISVELETVESQINNDNNVNIETVQSAYEQTLEQVQQLSPSDDQLAKRLSRELKIRRSADHKVIRSPSARKIGSMRRKSRDLDKTKLSRHRSWHVGSTTRASSRRGRPDSALAFLPTNESSTHRKSLTCDLTGSSSDTWTSAEGFFSTLSTTSRGDSALPPSGRASLARLRNQNAGMVLAKAKLFDQMRDSDSSGSGSGSGSFVRGKTGAGGGKIGARRCVDARLSYRVRSLKSDERRGRKSMSPRKRQAQLKQKQMALQYLGDSSGEKENLPEVGGAVERSVRILREANRIDNKRGASPKYSTPHIKRALNVRSPKRLCRTPGVERSTPLRALRTPIHHHHI